MSEDKIILQSDHLQVEIAQPGTAYAGTRFDWSGFITQVTLDGTHTFCMPESLQDGQGTGGIGLCNEFGNDLAIGYNDAAVGGSFPKPGIGLLVRDENPYHFFKTYPIARHFPIHVDQTENQATFIVDPVDERGYAMRLTKSINPVGKTLNITYHLENTSEKPILTNEYSHNFMGIDQKSIGPDYRLRFPYPVQMEDLLPAFRGMIPRWMRILPKAWQDRMLKSRAKQMQAIFKLDGNDLSLTQVPDKPFYTRLQGFMRTDEPQWELVHLPSGIGVREFDDFTPVRVAVWGVSHVISAEVFISIDLQPGQIMQWSRRFEFLDGGSS
jgi:hypothetical protein